MESPIARDCLALGRLVERHARYRPRHTAVVAPSGTRDLRLDWREFDRACVEVLAHISYQGQNVISKKFNWQRKIISRKIQSMNILST